MFGAELRNAAGKRILLGSEIIPYCLYAEQFTFESRKGKYFYTNLPYRDDYMVFVRANMDRHKNLYLGRPICQNINGKLRIHFWMETTGSYWHNDQQFPFPSWINGRIYVVGSLPDEPPAGWGMAMWNADNKLVFNSNSPMAPLMEPHMTDAARNNYSREGYFIGHKRACQISVASRDIAASQFTPERYLNEWDTFSLYVDMPTGKLFAAYSYCSPAKLMPKGFSYQHPTTWWIAAPIQILDTTYADRYFFND